MSYAICIQWMLQDIKHIVPAWEDNNLCILISWFYEQNPPCDSFNLHCEKENSTDCIVNIFPIHGRSQTIKRCHASKMRLKTNLCTIWTLNCDTRFRHILNFWKINAYILFVLYKRNVSGSCLLTTCGAHNPFLMGPSKAKCSFLCQF